MIIRWKNIYETGIDHTDQWNKKLIDAINSFYKYISLDTLTENAENLINHIIIESIAQFSVEKRFFAHYNYSSDQIESHIDEHNHFINTLKISLQRIQSGDVLASYKVVDYLRSWIVNHVLISDKNFALYASQLRPVKV